MTGSGYDAVVVGAGPAGSIAALVLARGGARVALADKAAFPRDKACGDLIGPRGVQVLADLGLTVPDAGHGSDLLAVGPSGRRSRLPAFPGRSYPGHGIVVPRVAFDNALREAALAAGAVGVRARVTAVENSQDRTVRAVLADGQRLAGDVIIGADGALSTVARLTGMLDPYPGYGWLFPGADGQANVGIGIGMGGTRHSAPLRGDLDRFTALLRSRGDLRPNADIGPVVGGWLRMGGTGTPAAAGNVLLVGDAAGLINPLQGEGIAPAMISARLAAEAVLADRCRAGPAYTRALHAAFGHYLPGASALQRALLRRPWAASASMRLVTAPVVRRLVASTWSIYWNGLADGAAPRPAAWAARGLETAATVLARGSDPPEPPGAPPASPSPLHSPGRQAGRPHRAR